MRKLLVMAALLFPGLLGAAPPLCLTDPEMMAEVAARYLVEQEYRAVLCAYLYGEALQTEPGALLQLARDIALKFDGQFSRYQELRRERFQRLFGERWELALRGDRFLKLWHLRQAIPRLEEDACAATREGLEAAFRKDWAALRRALEPPLAALRGKVPVCSVETRGLYPPFSGENPEIVDTQRPPLPGFPNAKPEPVVPARMLPGFEEIPSPR